MAAAAHICVECGAANETLRGPCVKCGSHAFRGERDRELPASTYDKVANSVGLVPNIRWRDNLYQGLAVAATTAVGSGIGFALAGLEGAVFGVLGGLVVGFVTSGVVLMIVGWVRTARR